MGHVQYAAADAGAAVLGHVVENHVLQGALHRLLTDRQGVRVFSGVGVGAWLNAPPFACFRADGSAADTADGSQNGRSNLLLAS
jgi:hypothetical protein